MGETLSKLFVPLQSLPGLYQISDECISEASFDPTLSGVMQLLFLGLVYGFILFKASNMIAEGSELLLLFPKIAPIVGSVVLPVLGAVPDGAIVLFSGLGSRQKAIEQLDVGVGALAGSTVMLLTVPWFLTIYAGRVDIMEDGHCDYENVNEDEEASHKAESAKKLKGVEADPSSMNSGAWVMFLTSVSYMIIQLAAMYVSLFKKKDTSEEVADDESGPALIALAFCICCFVWYIYSQIKLASDVSNLSNHSEAPDGVYVLESLIESKQLGGLEKGLISLQAMFYNQLRSMDNENDTGSVKEPLLANETETGYNSFQVSEHFGKIGALEHLVEQLFQKYDTNGSNSIELIEFYCATNDMNLSFSDSSPEEEKCISRLNEINILFNTIDKDNSGSIGYQEFRDFVLGNLKLKSKLDATNQIEFEEELNSKKEKQKVAIEALWLMSVGTFLVLAFSDPMVEVMSMIGKLLNLSSFYVSFILAPLASNASEFIAAYVYAKKKTQRTVTLSLSTLQGAAIMNNTFCLSIFLALIYFRELEWNYSAETFSILFAELAMVWISTTPVQTEKTAWLVLSLFPISLFLVGFLKHFGFK